MNINAQIAASPDELKALEFKKMKALIKRDLKRLEKNTSPEKPVPVMVWGDFAYGDKPSGAGLLLVGKWKGAFKQFAKQQVAAQAPLGAIGQVYFAGVDEDGQKCLQIDLNKGKGKTKTDKLAKGLRKLLPQATYNIQFGELSEEAMNLLEQRLENEADDLEPELRSDEPTQDEGGQIELEGGQNIALLLESNLSEISASLAQVKSQILPRIQLPAEDDLSAVEDLIDLCQEWLEIYAEAGDCDLETRYAPAAQKVRDIQSKAEKIGQALQSHAARAQSEQAQSAPVQKNEESKVPAAQITAQLRLKSKGEEVRLLQSLLAGLGYNLGKAGIDGDFGDMTHKAVVALQTRYGLLPTGTVEPNSPTWLALNGLLPLPVQPTPPAAPPQPTASLQDGQSKGIFDQNLLNSIFTSSQNQKDENGKALSGICDKASRAMIYKYLNAAGLVKANVRLNDNLYDDIDPKSPYFIDAMGMKGGSGNGKNYYALVTEGSSAQGDAHAARNYTVDAAMAQKAVKYIDYHLAQTPPIPVMVGVSYKDDSYNDGTTDHFIVVVGMSQKGGSKRYHYLEPGTSRKEDKGTNLTDNVLVQDPREPYKFWDEKSGIGNGAPFILSAVVKYQKDRGNDDWERQADATAVLRPENVRFALAPGVPPLNAKAQLVLSELCALAGVAAPHVTATYRSPEQQAGVILQNLEQFGAARNRSAYQNPKAAGLLVDAYEAALAQGADKAKLLQIVLKMLVQVGPEQLSSHCRSGNPAIDIDPACIPDCARFEQIAKKDSRLRIIVPPQDRTYHIEIL